MHHESKTPVVPMFGGETARTLEGLVAQQAAIREQLLPAMVFGNGREIYER